MKLFAAVMGVSTLLLSIILPSASGEQTTIRFGEQDSCKVTGVTTITTDGEDASVIRFDLSQLPPDAPVKKAVLRLWMDNLDDRGQRVFGFSRWDDPKFDGFKVFCVDGDEEPLDASYPFVATEYGCHEWDVTTAVQAWAKDAGSNKGLRTNFPMPPADYQPAWQRPYLEVTYAGVNPNLPKQPTDIKAFYRSGQVFLTWKQIPYDGAFFDSTYRVYKHAQPITAENLDEAELVGEVHKNSQLNYRRSAYSADGMGNHYRLEIERNGETSTARLVKRIGGQETTLAETKRPPDMAPYDWQSNPNCPGWHDPGKENWIRQSGINTWGLDRMTVRISGKTITVVINGKDAFPDAVVDSSLHQGSPGIFCVGKSIFDNFEVKLDGATR